MKKINTIIILASLVLIVFSCNSNMDNLDLKVIETSANGNKMTSLTTFNTGKEAIQLAIIPEQKFQKITGFGGSFTEASASLLNKLSEENRESILEAYFGDSGAKYSLTRTHMNSCDFSLSNYSYAPIAGDDKLEHFSIDEDREDLIPMIKGAMDKSSEGFKILSSPWTAPPWMKDNNDWLGGKLLPEHYGTWALFFSKYINAYKLEGIDIWGFTVENEPLGNNKNWESMHFSPKEMTDFVVSNLGPQMEKDGHNVKILGYDQNRGDELKDWVDEMYRDEASTKYFDGTAIHWYASTYDFFPSSLQYAHNAAPDKYLIQSEACADSEVPKWKDDKWYWSKEATDWGWDWAPEEQKYLHPKYAPVNRYARDIIGCLNNWVDGWIDWNMVLDRQGGPNWFKNWCVAPIIVDPDADEVYLTPIYYTLSHFSKYIRPGAQRIGFELSNDVLMATAAQNKDGSIVIILFNEGIEAQDVKINLGDKFKSITINSQAIQTIII